MKLDEKRRTSECDGRYGSERYLGVALVPGFRVFIKLRVSKYSKNFTIYPCKTAL